MTLGDFASTAVTGEFTLVYLLRNTITNLTTQDQQVEAFRNAAGHLQPGGVFVIENYVPELQRLPPGETRHVFMATPAHVGFEEYDVANQIAVSHHYWVIDGQLEQFSSPHRYVWPAELDLMARLAGLTLRDRWSNWGREPFTSASRSHISVWEKATGPSLRPKVPADRQPCMSQEDPQRDRRSRCDRLVQTVAGTIESMPDVVGDFTVTMDELRAVAGS